MSTVNLFMGVGVLECVVVLNEVFLNTCRCYF